MTVVLFTCGCVHFPISSLLLAQCAVAWACPVLLPRSFTQCTSPLAFRMICQVVFSVSIAGLQVISNFCTVQAG